MKILGICGSHRKESSTAFFLKKALGVCENEGLETEIVLLSEKEIGECTVCDVCKNDYVCTVEDDMQELYGKMESADAIIIASPTYFGLVTGKLKSLMDRSLPLRRNGMKLSNKVGGAIAVAASRNGGQEFVCQQIRSWMLIHEMIVVADKETSHFGGIAWVSRGKDAKDDETGIETCENLGKRIAEVLGLMKK